MGIITIIFLTAVFFYGIFIMRKHSKVMEDQYFKNMKYNDKIAITKVVKECWKKTILLLATVFAAILINLSTFIGKGNAHSEEIAILGIGIGVLVTISLIINDKKKSKEIENLMNL